jgi:hypothetical protein
MASTLRCSNEEVSQAKKLGDALNASYATWTIYGREGTNIDRITSGRVGACARDMVGECRRCSTVVCRVSVDLPSPPLNLANQAHRTAY